MSSVLPPGLSNPPTIQHTTINMGYASANLSNFFAAGLALYPLAFYLSIPEGATPSRLALSREVISFVHCTFMVVLAGICLRDNHAALTPSPGTAAAPSPDSDLPIIATKSSFGNAIMALETAYLLQDSVLLRYVFRKSKRLVQAGMVPGSPLGRHLSWHHAGLTLPLITLQWYISKGREKGILVLVMLMLMNTSSPFGTVRWYLINFRPKYRRAIATATIAYLCTYAVCRVYLIYHVLSIFGSQQRLSAFESFRKLRLPCKAGTATMAIVNSAWFLMALKNFIKRDLKRAG